MRMRSSFLNIATPDLLKTIAVALCVWMVMAVGDGYGRRDRIEGRTH
jgi:hypothetical protein